MLLNNKQRSLLIAAFCLAMTAANVAAEVSIEETYHYYLVNGNSTKELRTSIDDNRKINTGLNNFDASTHWTMTWTFKYLPTQTGCHITQATVTVTIEYRLPRWPGRETSNNATLNRAWDTYSNNLYLHESEHGHIAKNTAKKIERGLLDIPMSQGECQAVEAQANLVASQLVEKSRQHHSDFDTATNHGSDTGATFP